MILICSFAVHGYADQTSLLEPNDQKSYLIFDLRAPFSVKTPTWLAVRHQRALKHLPNGESIVEISPGEYQLVHIDFENNIYSGNGTIYFPTPSHFRAEAGVIYYLGTIEIVKAGPDKFTMSYLVDEAVIRSACKKAFSVIATFPVSTVGGKRSMVNCNK